MNQDQAGAAIRVVIAAPFSDLVSIHERASEFADEIDVCGVVSSPATVTDQTRVLQPDVLILSEELGADLAETAARLAVSAPTTRVVMLVRDREAAGRGAATVLRTDATASELRAAVMVAAGRMRGRTAPAAHSRDAGPAGGGPRWFWEEGERPGRPVSLPEDPGDAVATAPETSHSAVAIGAEASAWPPPWLHIAPDAEAEQQATRSGGSSVPATNGTSAVAPAREAAPAKPSVVAAPADVPDRRELPERAAWSAAPPIPVAPDLAEPAAPLAFSPPSEPPARPASPAEPEPKHRVVSWMRRQSPQAPELEEPPLFDLAFPASAASPVPSAAPSPRGSAADDGEGESTEPSPAERPQVSPTPPPAAARAGWRVRSPAPDSHVAPAASSRPVAQEAPAPMSTPAAAPHDPDVAARPSAAAPAALPTTPVPLAPAPAEPGLSDPAPAPAPAVHAPLTPAPAEPARADFAPAAPAPAPVAPAPAPAALAPAPVAPAPAPAALPTAEPVLVAEPEPEPVAPAVVEEPIVEQPRTRTRRPGRTRADTILVFSGKGGVGKSVVATNLAVSLSARGAKVALVDLNLQYGDVAVLLHIESHPTSIELLAQQGEQLDKDYLDEVMATGPEAVRVLLAPASPEFADLVTAASLRAVLRELSRSFDYVVVDSPAHLEERVLEVIEVADQILVVSSFNITSVKDTRVTLRLLQSLGVERPRIAVVLNQTQPKVGFAKGDIEKSLRYEVLAQLPYDTHVDDTVDNGRPMVLGHPKSDFTKQFRAVVDFIAAEDQAAESAAAAKAKPEEARPPAKRKLFGR